MRIFYDQNVFDAALDRIRHIYDTFDNVVVSFSGGKDSTVTLFLAIMVAREKGRLPVTTVFLDQEAEWQSAVDYMRVIGEMPEVDLRWYQIPFKITHSHSKTEVFMHCWDPEIEDKWMRPKEPDSIKVNDLTKGKGKRKKPVDSFFKSVIDGIQRNHFPDGTCFMGGVRAEESPGRMMSLTNHPVFHGLTWGKRMRDGVKELESVVMYPIYDWSYKDVWKAIHNNGWPYARLYDLMYAQGVPAMKMRLSSLCHENAVSSLGHLQDLDKDTWESLCDRLPGIATGKNNWAVFAPKELPFMFQDWREYRDYLTEKLPAEDDVPKFQKKFATMDAKYIDSGELDEGWQNLYFSYGAGTVMRNDLAFVTLADFEAMIKYGHRNKTAAPKAALA